MRPHSRHRHSLHCILPPYLSREIARNGTREQRERILRTLSIDTTFRSMRVARGAMIPLGQRLIPSPMMVESQLQRTIYDMKNTEALPGTVVRTEGQGDTSDVCVNEAYNGLGATYDLFWEVFARNSIDGMGMPLHAHVHYGENYNNAFWDGERMVFGDGDGDLFNRFTIAVDIIGHELTHGVTEHDGPLTYFSQSGALNESISDVFGSLVKQRVLNQKADQADWLIGEGLFTDNVEGVALRSMKDPGTAYDDDVLGKDPQPGHMRSFVKTWEDNGGVHINSGIPNRAFYLVATQLGGYAWERAGHIWYEALRDPRLRSNAGFGSFARLTVMAAGRLYGSDKDEEKAVRDAWNQVGIRVSRERAGEPAWGPGVQLPQQAQQQPPTH
ncbi:peptidase M4 family protein [Pyxidicoccus fallax]|uniref:Neutral metalloproteinase n=1 Tax=Pyxidicoccus fallax TaxID=394095 RepID=A0A848L4L5_9BACT|nr:M4 family metallopeptidase [Pyxidicoccus fallax]NMO13397.1 peptidase M4 family protein [Pyxidicoccus fallax]NPC80306.1 peptidase M4 family protein [Pyxidicoccus fallax]